MILLVLIAVGLYQIAKKREMKNKWLWPILGVGGYFGGAFLTGVIMGLTDSSALNDETQLQIYAIIGALLGMGSIFLIQQIVIKRQEVNQESKMEEVMDDSFDDL